MAERTEAAVDVRQGLESPEPPPRDVLEEHPLDRIPGTKLEDLLDPGLDRLRHPGIVTAADRRVPAVPIHIRAEPGEYADACLLPGDPMRAKYIAETFLDGAVERNSERGMLGYTGTYEGRPVSVQSTGMGCPSAAIVIEELVQLGVKRLLRVGTCGGLQPDLGLGDLIVALTAIPADATARTYVPEPHCPTADWELVHGAVHHAKERGQPVRVGPIVSSDVFYNPDGEQYRRWSERGVLAVEMEAAVLFTLGALRKVAAGCLLTVSDVVVEGAFTRISDEELRAAVDRMTQVALATVTTER